MILLLVSIVIFLLDNIAVTSDSINYILYDENINATNGDKFIQEIISGQKPTVRPENLIFTAPFKLCKGECKTNNNHFRMIFPIHVGLKRSQTVYKSLYPRDETFFLPEDNAPFKKSTKKAPNVLCPMSDEELKKLSARPKCAHKASKSIFIMLSSTYLKVQAVLPWERWSWSLPQAPIEHFFRRYENNIMPIKTPNVQCECPPNKGCNMEYEINKDIIYFQNLKGIIKDHELMQLKEDFNERKYRRNKNLRKLYNETVTLNRKRRFSDIILGSKELTKDCCCPTKIVKIPAFITNKKFDEVIERLNKKGI